MTCTFPRKEVRIKRGMVHFGDYPLNRITRDDVQAWVQRLIDAGKKPSTVRHHYFVLRMVLRHAVWDNGLPSNPADNVKLPNEYTARGGDPGVVDDPSQFLTATQVSALVSATPWPYNVYVHVAAWAGLRAGELGGLRVADVELPEPSINPNAAGKPGAVQVRQTIIRDGGGLVYDTPKTAGSRRRVPLTAETTALLRDYLTHHPRLHDPEAPLFPGMRLTAPTGASEGAPNPRRDPEHWRVVAERQAANLAALSVPEAEARLVLDWDSPLRHTTFYKAVFRPAVLRAMRMAPTAAVSPALKFHSLRHTYVSLCVAAGLPPLQISRFAGHKNVKTTLNIYTHLFNTDDHAEAMAALGAMNTGVPRDDNVVSIRRPGHSAG